MAATEAEILTVSQLNRLTREIIESQFPLIWLQGELSNLARPASGHWYFTLKDEQAQVRCAMFRMKNRLITIKPENGMQVLVRARVSFYEARGEFQLLVEQLEAAGDGLLRQRFLRLKDSLAQRGWFDEAHKKPLPQLPQRVAIITSASGAALRDILSVMRRRFANLPLLVLPVTVQGDSAAATIIAAIEQAQRSQLFDVIILARGGGSMEDLWCFNDEGLALAIYQCEIPIVTGIGHEIDFTIADFVADCRAATPSAAAELVAPDRKALAMQVTHYYQRLRHRGLSTLQHKSQQLKLCRQALRHPTQQLHFKAQRVDELEQRLRSHLHFKLERLRNKLEALQQHLRAYNPTRDLLRYRETLQGIRKNLGNAFSHRLQAKKSDFIAAVRQLDAVSPLATLNRGFAIARKCPGQDILHDTQSLHQGDTISVQLAQGAVKAEILEIEPERTLKVEQVLDDI